VVLLERMDEIGKPAWITLMVLGFWVFWPVGLATLAFIVWSGRMRAWKCAPRGRWYGARSFARGCSAFRAAPMSGNAAFDEYREETLRRLEEEQREFVDYLERLRRARDKAEFDQFMAERRQRPDAPEAA